MKINIATPDGIIELIVDEDDTVHHVQQKVQRATGRPVDSQRMIYSGKQMEGGRSLSHYEVKEGGTISLVVRTKQLHTTHTAEGDTSDANNGSPNTTELRNRKPNQRPLEDESQSQSQFNAIRLKQREVEATTPHEIDPYSEHGFDDDDYLINPESHYDKLGMLEKMVVESSEYYRTRGNYEPSICHIYSVEPLFSSFHCRPDVLDRLSKITHLSTNASLPPGEENQGTIRVALSLGQSYLILSHVLDMLENLTQKGFCNDSFTILMRRQSGPGAIAEMVEVERDMIVDFHEGISATISKILKAGRPLSDSGTAAAISEILLPACLCYMRRLDIPLIEQLSLTVREILLLSRILTLMLDIGLVSYMGSHGSRFDLEYLEQDHSELLVVSGAQIEIGFLFSLQKLACLDKFLNCQQVWTIQPLWTIPKDLVPPSSPVAILTTIKAFADTWGPIWEVPAGEKFPDHIRQLNVSTGWICRVEGWTKCSVEGAVSCHWFEYSSLIPYLSLGRYEDRLIHKSQKLLIGARLDSSLETNTACSYKLDDLERDYGLCMTPLGTSASTWAYNERQVGFSASQYIGITVLGTQKKLPCITQKQAIWNKWTNQPTRANPLILNSYLGVEISHCTGNARRVKLRDIFTMNAVQAILSRQFPDWILTDFGLSLQSAFFSDDDTTIEDVWVKHYKERGKIAELVCCMLEMLKKTGTSSGMFSAAFLNQQRELSMPIEPRLNSWTEFLQDSHLTAVYAIVNENCLHKGECGNFVATCNAGPVKPTGFTVFETKIAVANESAARDRISLNQRGWLQRVSETEEGVQVLTWDAGRARELGGTLGRLLGTKQTLLSREVQDRYELGGQHVSVLVRSTVPSFGGLPARRTTQTSKSVVRREVNLRDSLPIRAAVDESQMLQHSILHREQPQRARPPTS